MRDALAPPARALAQQAGHAPRQVLSRHTLLLDGAHAFVWYRPRHSCISSCLRRWRIANRTSSISASAVAYRARAAASGAARAEHTSPISLGRRETGLLDPRPLAHASTVRPTARATLARIGRLTGLVLLSVSHNSLSAVPQVRRAARLPLRQTIMPHNDNPQSALPPSASLSMIGAGRSHGWRFGRSRRFLETGPDVRRCTARRACKRHNPDPLSLVPRVEKMHLGGAAPHEENENRERRDVNLWGTSIPSLVPLFAFVIGKNLHFCSC